MHCLDKTWPADWSRYIVLTEPDLLISRGKQFSEAFPRSLIAREHEIWFLLNHYIIKIVSSLWLMCGEKPGHNHITETLGVANKQNSDPSSSNGQWKLNTLFPSTN